MKTFVIATAIVVIGYMFGKAMTHTAEFFIDFIKRSNRDDRED